MRSSLLEFPKRQFNQNNKGFDSQVFIKLLFDLHYIEISHFLLKTDNDNLFVPSAIHFEIIYLRPNQPAVVPCRVTNPQAKVSLHREVPPEEIPTNNTLVSYDPTKGFVLQSPSKEHEGVFYCKAETRGTPQISTKYQLLYVEGNDPQLGCQLTSVRMLTGSSPRQFLADHHT